MIDEKSDLIFLNNIILTKARDDNFSGYDPFDLLNSRLLKSTPFIRSEFFRLVWLQFGKNSPINFRPFLRVPKKRNPKGVALFIFGLLEEYQRTDDSDYLKEAQLLGTWLVGHCCDLVSWQHYCWGYHFDWLLVGQRVGAAELARPHPAAVQVHLLEVLLVHLENFAGEPNLPHLGLRRQLIREAVVVVDFGREVFAVFCFAFFVLLF